MTFRGWIEELTGLDIINYCSMASLGYDSLITNECLEGCYKLSGIPREFLQKFVVGGRCMTRNNKKWVFKGKKKNGKIVDWIEDFDGVSLYPSSLYRLKGFLKGKPKVIKKNIKDPEDLINDNINHFFIKVKCLNNPTFNLNFPLLSIVNENGIREFTNDVKDKVFYIDKTLYEECKEHQGLKFEVICGYYYDEGWNNQINKFIHKLFNERLRKKSEGNPIQEVYKLLMNSCYGKTLLKPIEQETKTCKKGEEWNKILNRYYNFITEFVETKNMIIYKQTKTINEQFNNVHQGIMVLSMSKRIMNEVMVLSEKNNLTMFYTDTDSIHILGDDIKKLRKLFNDKYCSDERIRQYPDEFRFRQKDLIGKFLGQFHSDFDSKKLSSISKDVIRASYSVFLGKKCYFDKLFVQDEKEKYHYDYHLRMKGVSSDAIEHIKNKKNDTYNLNSYEDIYNHLYYQPDKPITFDLLCGGEKVSFKYNADMSVRSLGDFKRTVSFKYEEGEL
jgi:hypothetical protein